jgi:hypothetical protein
MMYGKSQCHSLEHEYMEKTIKKAPYTTKTIKRTTVSYIEELARDSKRNFTQQLDWIIENWAKEHPEEAKKPYDETK